MTETTRLPLGSASLRGERRQVTVLFADMLSFTEISERLGEEGTFALIQPIYEIMAGAVAELSGSVNDFTGDGIMALFGAPESLEDAPLRACRAGLLILERLAAAAPGIQAKYGVRPQLRVGINSGPAVVSQVHGDGGGLTAIGDTVNLASRLQSLAEPGTVCLSEATERLVQGLVETTFSGTYEIKGKAEAQRVFRLNSLRGGTTRFAAAVGRGLSAYIGRERELDDLHRSLDVARDRLRVVDVVAEPGMGKSRLLHEFRQRLGENKPFVLSGSCTPDGQKTPFLPFIEVVRGSFDVGPGDAEREVARKLETGLIVLGLYSTENLGLLLNLLGLQPPVGALIGLDVVLIGLRTRDLIRHLLEAHCRDSTIVFLIEDLHWIDSVSEEVLREIVSRDDGLRLLVLHTRRPEYEPSWLDRLTVSTLRLEPLPRGDIRLLVQTRLGVDSLPDGFAQLVTEKADGNALFAEEIVSFLKERGALRASRGKIEFDVNAVRGALPVSVQSLLTARVDRLAPRDRELLQAAAVIGRSFDRQLLALVTGVPGDLGPRLAAMQALDLVYPEGNSVNYTFKHTLLRDALYESLLTGPRATLHLKIAEEIERRSGDRKTEVEALAHHYSQTGRADKAFAYLAAAGAKSLGVYSLDEAGQYFAAAIKLVESTPNCTSDEQFADLLVNYALCSNISLNLKPIVEIPARFKTKLDRLGDSHQRILIQHHYITTLVYSSKFREAAKAQAELSAMADRLEDPTSRAYALASGLGVSTHIEPKSIDDFEAQYREVVSTFSSAQDTYLQNFILAAWAWDELNRGRIGHARKAAEELMAEGRRMNDPRSMGYAMALKSLAALLSDDYAAALEFADKSISISRAPLEREAANSARHSALVLLRRPEALLQTRDFMEKCTTNGWYLLHSGPDNLWGAALCLNGQIGSGIRHMKQAISRREREGYKASADWCRMCLCEIYLEIVSGSERPSVRILIRNLLTLAITKLTAEKQILALVKQVRLNPQFDPNGHYIGRCEMILGLLYKAKKKWSHAAQHLKEAQRITSQFGPSPMLTRIETALIEVT
jgi:class 3 adenylate cyclase